MKTKAKRTDNGEWVVGWVDESGKEPCIWVKNGRQLGDPMRIDPSPLCEQVRGTELFEGDIVLVDLSKISLMKKTYEAEIFWSNDTNLHFGWALRDIESGGIIEFNPIYLKSSTGRNIHD